MAKVKDPEPPLNVRSGPSTDTSIVGKLNNGEWVSIQDEKDGWLQITNPIAGWISKQRTDHTCNRKIERIRFSSDHGRVTIADRFVGGGNHSYVFSLKQGQQLTITRANGPFPYVTMPGGRGYLLDGRREPAQNWTGEIPQTGEYAIELDSNFKGYQYSFLVEIQ
jgi:SH3-like domain-containing protein